LFWFLGPIVGFLRQHEDADAVEVGPPHLYGIAAALPGEVQQQLR
jgi:hypothetical protein